MSIQDMYLYDFGLFRLDAKRQRLLCAGEPLALPPKAVELLVLLVEHQGRVVEKDFLMAALWPDTIVEESNLTQNIYLLRKALGQTADGQPFIETFSKRGYKFVPAVQSVAADDDTLVVTRHTQARIRITQEEIETGQPQTEAVEMALLAPPALINSQAERAWPLQDGARQAASPGARRGSGVGVDRGRPLFLAGAA